MVSLSEQKHSTRWFLTAHFLHVLISTTFIYCIIWVSCAVTLCDKLGKIFFPATVHWGLVFQCCIICVVSQKPAIILYFATVFLAKQSTERQRGSDRKLGLSETCLQPFAMEFPRLNRLQSEPILKWEGIDQYKNWLRTEKSVSLENDRTDTWTWELGPLALFPEDFLIWSNSNLVTTVLNLDTLPSCHWACRRVERFVLSQPQEVFSLFVSDCGRVVWQTEQHVKGGEFRERIAVSFEHSSSHWAGDAMYLWDGGLRALSGPTFAPDWLQGGVRQPQTPQLWPIASGNSGTEHDVCCFCCSCSYLTADITTCELKDSP